MKRNLTLDVLKILLSFFVVGLHGSMMTEVDPTLAFTLKQGLFRVAVPTFLIISGYYYYNIKSLQSEAKFIWRLFLLYLIWFVFYIPIFHPGPIDSSLINTFFSGYGHLWYLIHTMYALLLLSLIKRIPFGLQVPVVSLCAVAGLLLQYHFVYDLLPIDVEKTYSTHRNGITFCLPFLYIGFIINKFEVRRISWFYILPALTFLLLESFLNHYTGKKSFDILIALYVFCPVLFLVAIHSTKSTHHKEISLISGSIYLIHPFFLKYLHLKFLELTQTELTLSAFFLSFFLSFAIIGIHRHFKYIL